MEKTFINGVPVRTAEEQNLLDRLQEFQKAAAALYDAWTVNLIDGDALMKHYPFEESFDDVLIRICIWNKTHNK